MTIASRSTSASAAHIAGHGPTATSMLDDTPPAGVPITPIAPPGEPAPHEGEPDPDETSEEAAALAEVRRRFVRSYRLGATLGTVVFLLVLGDGRWAPFRTAVASRVFSNFYDVQARALLDGHLDVPIGSLSIEGFRVDGLEYMYFPPWPSILRMPLFVVTDRFDGRLSAVSILVAYLLAIVFAGLIAWRIRTILAPDAPFGRVSAFAVAIWGTVLGAGSTLTFLASLPWVYHEAYMWAVAGTLGAIWALLEVARTPTAGRVAWVWFWATVTILSRATAGWAICAAVVAVGALLLARPPVGGSRWRGVTVIAAGVGALAIGVGINWAKFRHPYLFPLDRQVWTALNDSRAAALEANGGHLTGPQFVPTMLRAYLRPDGVRFTSVFPWLTLPESPPEAIGGAIVDQRYRTGSVTAFMPLLVGLSVLGAVSIARTRRPGRAAVRIAALATLLIPCGVLAYGYVAHRYTAEFVPALVLLSAAGLTTLRALDRNRRRWRVLAAGAVAVAGAYGVAATLAVSVQSARVTSRGEPLMSLVERRLTWAGMFGDDPRARSASALPTDPATDELVVVGDCEAVYLATGDLYEPWVPVALRPLDVLMTVGRHGAPGETTLLGLGKTRERALKIQHDGSGNYRLAVVGNSVDEWSDWTPLETGVTVRVSITADTARNQYLIDAPGWVFTSVPIADWNDDWISVPNLLEPARPTVTPAPAIDAHVVWGAPPTTCQHLTS